MYVLVFNVPPKGKFLRVLTACVLAEKQEHLFLLTQSYLLKACISLNCTCHLITDIFSDKETQTKHNVW